MLTSLKRTAGGSRSSFSEQIAKQLRRQGMEQASINARSLAASQIWSPIQIHLEFQIQEWLIDALRSPL